MSTDKEKPKFALSIRQPWAWLIVKGYKRVENRTWWTAFRGPFWVHAGKAMSRGEYEQCREFIEGFTTRIELPAFGELPRGGIVGEARLVDCVRFLETPWFVGPCGFVLQDARELPFVECKGALGFFEPEGRQ